MAKSFQGAIARAKSTNKGKKTQQFVATVSVKLTGFSSEEKNCVTYGHVAAIRRSWERTIKELGAPFVPKNLANFSFLDKDGKSRTITFSVIDHCAKS